jgi:hypothetical protein
MFLFIPLTAMVRLVSEEIPAMKPWAIIMGEETPRLRKKRFKR